MNYNIPTINSKIFRNLTKMTSQYQNICQNILLSYAPMIKQNEAIAENFFLTMKPIIKQNQELTKRLTSIIPIIDSSIFDNIRGIQSVFKDSNLTQIAQQQQKLAKNLSLTLSQVDTSFLVKLNKFTKDLQKINFDTEKLNLEDVHLEIHYEDIKVINDKVENGITLDKSEVLTIDKLLALISILLALYSLFIPDDSQHIKTQQMIQQQKTTILTSQNTYYEVIKNVHVRQYPDSSSKSKKLDIIYPKQKLLLIESKPYWIQVEYFNDKLQETVIGWVSKKNTKRLSE